MEQIGITANKVIQALEGSLQPGQNKLIEDGLKKVLTKKEQRHIKYYSISNSGVVMGVDSSVWLYVLSFKRKQLLQQISEVVQKEQSSLKVVFRLATKKWGRIYEA